MRILIVLCLAAFMYLKAHAQESVHLEPIQVQQSQETQPEFTGLAPSILETPLNIKKASVERQHLEKLSDLTQSDASITDSYNASGYYEHLNIRGYTLDNRFNYYREGLLISAESPLSFYNKESLDIIKGVSGFQAGSASPGGAVNYQVKRPQLERFEKIKIQGTDSQALLLLGDINHPLSQKSQMRWILAAEKLQEHIENSKGHAYLLAFSHNYLFSERTVLESEIEWSQHSQYSQATTSLWGNRVPSLKNPDLNINKQAWAKPVVFDGLTASSRLSSRLQDWDTSATLGLQILKTDDRLTYPYGCSTENRFDRFCFDGSYDLYDYRSENEWRKTYGVKLLAQKQFKLHHLTHGFSIGTQHSYRTEDYEAQAYNFVGQGNADGTAPLPENPSKLDPNTNRRAQSHEVHASYSLGFENIEVSSGLRLTHLERKSFRTDSSRPTDFSQNFALPWLGVSANYRTTNIFFSYAEGIESYVTPNKSSYLKAGEFLPDARTHQYELGIRSLLPLWAISVFKIDRPSITDTGSLFEKDGLQEHLGAEINFKNDIGRWHLASSLTLLKAEETHHHLDPSLNGKRPVNVPDQSFRWGLGYSLLSSLNAKVFLQSSYEGKRAITADNSLELSPWTRFDLLSSWQSKIYNSDLHWNFEIYNLFDHHHWKESPTQYGHIYLYPELRRLFKLSLAFSL